MYTQKSLRVWVGVSLLMLGAMPGRADEKGEALFKEVEAATKAVSTLSADLAMSQKLDEREMKVTGKVSLKRPNKAQIDLNAPISQSVVSDGKTTYQIMAGQKQYLKRNADPDGRDLGAGWALPVTLFFNQDLSLFAGAPNAKPKHGGTEKIGGIEYQILEIQGGPEKTDLLRFYVSPDKIITGFRATLKPDGREMKLDAFLNNVKLGAELDEKLFAYTPPADFKLFDPAKDQPNFEEKLIAVGKPAPKFTLTSSTGSKVSLADAVKNKRAVLINFWFYHCGACREEFPHLQKLYTELKSKGFDILAINGSDDKATINKYLTEKKFTFRALLGGENGGLDYDVAEKYGVMAYPTNYLIDSDGNVLWRSVGFDEAGLRKALAKVGLK